MSNSIGCLGLGVWLIHCGHGWGRMWGCGLCSCGSPLPVGGLCGLSVCTYGAVWKGKWSYQPVQREVRIVFMVPSVAWEKGASCRWLGGFLGKPFVGIIEEEALIYRWLNWASLNQCYWFLGVEVLGRWLDTRCCLHAVSYKIVSCGARLSNSR